MTAAAELLAELSQRGVRLAIGDGRLRIISPPGVMTPALADLVIANAESLLPLVAEEEFLRSVGIAPCVPEPVCERESALP